MARVNATEVREILTASESAALTDQQITAAITAANVIVNGFADAPCHTATSLKEVERYLAADIATGTTGGGTVEQEKIGDASEKRAMSRDGQSQYFRTATMLDCSGQLVDFDKRNAQLFTIGSIDANSPRED